MVPTAPAVLKWLWLDHMGARLTLQVSLRLVNVCFLTPGNVAAAPVGLLESTFEWVQTQGGM